jgi:hypothetical protein
MKLLIIILSLGFCFVSCTKQKKEVPIWEQENRWPHVNDFPKPYDTVRVRLTDAEFISAANKNIRDNVIDYFRSKEMKIDIPDIADTAATLKRANDILKGCYDLSGVRHCYPGEIEWLYNPTEDSTGQFDKEWTYRLTRCFHWWDLINAHRITGNQAYVDEIIRQQSDFMEKMPRPRAYCVQNDEPLYYTFPGWNTLNVSRRAGNTWLKAFHYIKKLPDTPDNVILAFAKSLFEHALYLEKYHMYRNWLIAESAALYKMGILFSDFKKGPAFRKTAIQRLESELKNQFYPDGIQYELAPGYHGFTLRLFASVILESADSPYPLPDSFRKRLRTAFEYPALSAAPDGTYPHFNDTRPGNSIKSALDLGFHMFPENDIVKFGKRFLEKKPGWMPEKRSYGFNYGGQYFMRTDWTEKALYLAADFGPYGIGHYHEDKLSFVVYGFGKWLVTEGGFYPYNYFSRWRKYMVSSLAHNTVLVDGMSQARLTQPWQTSWRTDKPLDNRWMSNEKYDYVRGTYGEGYVPFDMPKKAGYMDDGVKPVNSAIHTRAILFVKPEYWIVIDELNSLDNKSHRFETLFHLNAGNVALYSDPLQKRIVSEGLDGEEVRGWMPARDSVVPAPVVRCFNTREKLRNIYCIYPYQDENPVKQCNIDNKAGELLLSLNNGRTDELIIDKEDGLTLSRSGSLLFNIKP